MLYDLFITCAPKDYNKVEYCIKYSTLFLNPKPKNIYVISPTRFIENRTINGFVIKNFLDQEVIDYNKDRMIYRPNWIKQQLIKLLQNITESDKYLMLDSDFFITSNIDLEENKFFLSLDQNHLPYFTFQKKFLNFDKVYHHSFITEIMLFDKNKINEMLKSAKMDKESFIEFCYLNINKDCYLAEQELYGNFIVKNYNNIKFENLKTIRVAKDCKEDEVVWHNSEIEYYIEFSIKNSMKGIGIHSWV